MRFIVTVTHVYLAHKSSYVEKLAQLGSVPPVFIGGMKPFMLEY
jgi:hypothetical protein